MSWVVVLGACGGETAAVAPTDTSVATADTSDVGTPPAPLHTGLVHSAGGAAWSDARHRLVVMVGRSEPAGVLESGGLRLTLGAGALLE